MAPVATTERLLRMSACDPDDILLMAKPEPCAEPCAEPDIEWPRMSKTNSAIKAFNEAAAEKRRLLSSCRSSSTMGQTLDAAAEKRRTLSSCRSPSSREQHSPWDTVRPYLSAGAPFAMAEMLAKEDSGIDRRIFLLDNSGSTCEADGYLVTCTEDGSYRSMNATRWEEIATLAMDQARWNSQTGVRSEFYLLNPPCPQKPQEGRDFVVIDPQEGSVSAQVESLGQMLEGTSPHGRTPLTERLRVIRERLKGEEEHGRRIMLSIVTDGLPTGSRDDIRGSKKAQEDFVQELRLFAESFNAFVVVRLCTDDNTTTAYYNKIDEELELPLDIIGDIREEAGEMVANGNGWFAYSPLIHTIREGGTMAKIFDLLDERPLKPVEISMFLEFLLRGPDDEPFPRSPKELYDVARSYVTSAPLVYNGRLGRLTPPVDLKLLKKALGRTAWGRAKSVPTQMLSSLRGLVSKRQSQYRHTI